MSEQNDMVCCGGAKLIFACSGAADVGAVADQAARKLTEDGAGSMFCMAGLAGQVKPIMEKTRSASTILAIDGCPLNCVKSGLAAAGFSNFEHLQLADLGMTKGQTPLTSGNVDKVATAATAMLTES